MRRRFYTFGIFWILLILVFSFFYIYKDLKINKLLNYHKKPLDLVVQDANVDTNSTTKKVNFEFTTKDNYFGGVRIKISKLNEIKGDLVFSLTDLQRQQVVSQTKFGFGYFENFSAFPFGFPIIDDSENKKYQITLEFISHEENLPAFLADLRNNPVLEAKFVYPKEVVLRNPTYLVRLLANRSFNVIESMKLSNVLIPTFIIAFIASSFFDVGKNINERNKKSPVTYLESFNPFAISLLLALILPLVYVMNKQIVYKYAGYLWLSILISLLWSFFANYQERAKTKLLAVYSTFSNLILKKNWNWYTFFLIILISGFKESYILGGDDTRVFYLYPNEFLVNYAINIAQNLAISSIDPILPPTTLFPFVSVLVILKSAFGNLNLQSMLYTANIIGGVVFFYALLNYMLPSKKTFVKFSFALVAMMYVFSIFNFYVLFNSKLMSIYLISLYPLIVLMFLKYMRENIYWPLFVIATTVSLFTLNSVAAPWFLGTFFASLPLFIFYCFKNIKRALIGILMAAILMFILNIHWLIYLPSTAAMSSVPSTRKNSIVSQEFRNENEIGIRQVSKLNNVFFPLLNTYHKKIQESFNWPYISIYQNWFIRFVVLNITFFVVVLLPGVLGVTTKNSSKLYIALLITFLFAIYLFTVDIGEFGIEIFTFLNNSLPGFVLFRNMYDKFSYPLAFLYALLVGVSFKLIFSKLKSKSSRNMLIAIFALAVIVQAKPFLTSEFEKLPIWTTQRSYWDTKNFNPDYLMLIEFIKHQEDEGRYLSLPLTTGNAAVIADSENENHFYNGVSPILTLSGKNDLSGLLSFGVHKKNVESYLRNEEPEHFAELLQKLNVKYIIVNNSITPDIANSFVFSDDIYYLQNTDFYEAILGDKIKDFGISYTLYKIKPKYDSSKIYLTSNFESFSNTVNVSNVKKVSQGKYEINLDGNMHDYIVFLEPYTPGWKVKTETGKELNKIDSNLAFGYTNAWDLKGLGSDNKHLELFYEPYSYFWPVLFVSIAGYCFCFVYIMLGLRKKS